MGDDNDIRHGRHCVFKMHVHLVFVAKYRRNVFDRDAINRLRTIFAKVCADFGAQLIDIALLLCPPTVTMASPGYCRPVLLVTGTTTTLARFRLAASLLTITAGRVLRISLPTAGSNDGVVNHITVYRTASASRLQNKQLADDLMVGILHRHRLNAEAMTLCH